MHIGLCIYMDTRQDEQYSTRTRQTGRMYASFVTGRASLHIIQKNILRDEIQRDKHNVEKVCCVVSRKKKRKKESKMNWKAAAPDERARASNILCMCVYMYTHIEINNIKCVWDIHHKIIINFQLPVQVTFKVYSYNFVAVKVLINSFIVTTLNDT